MEAFDPKARPIEEIIQEIAAEVPPEDWAKCRTDDQLRESDAIVRFLERDDIAVDSKDAYGVLVYDTDWKFDAMGKNVIAAAREAIEKEREYLAEKQKREGE